MICKKCGAAMPDNAKFCGQCGWTVEKTKTSPVALASARKQAKMYRIASIVLAVLCILLAIGWASTAKKDPYRTIESYETEVKDIDRSGVELSGIYVVGEDAELPAGRYNIYPAEGKSYLDVEIYDDMENAKKRYDKNYNSLAIADLYSLTRGYKLKEGQIVAIYNDSAFFELVSESEGTVDDASDAGSGDTADGSDAGTGNAAGGSSDAGTGNAAGGSSDAGDGGDAAGTSDK